MAKAKDEPAAPAADEPRAPAAAGVPARPDFPFHPLADAGTTPPAGGWDPRAPIAMDKSGIDPTAMVKVKLEGSTRIVAYDPEMPSRDGKGKGDWRWMSDGDIAEIPLRSFMQAPCMGKIMDETGAWVDIKSPADHPWKLFEAEKEAIIKVETPALKTAARPEGSIGTGDPSNPDDKVKSATV